MTLDKFPDADPSITLDFTKSKKLDPRITFARASSGTTIGEGYGDVIGDNYLFQENVPRLTDKGLLIEQATIQYAKSNINGSDSGWAGGSESTEVAPPFGDPTASVRKTTAKAQCIAINAPSGTTQTFFSMYVKPGNWRRFAFRLVVGGYSYRWFDLSGTTPLVFIDDDKTPAAPGTFICEQYPNDWWRIGVKAGTWGYKSVWMFDYDADGKPIRNSATPGGQPSGSYFYAWGAQAETNGFCTSFIPNPNTDNTQITRAPDLVTLSNNDFTDWYNNSEGTWMLNVNALGSSDDYPRLLQTNQSHNFEYQTLNSAPGSAALAFQGWLTGQTTKTPFGIAPTGEFKTAANYSIGNKSPIYIDGTEQVRGDSTYTPGTAVGTPPTELRLFRQNNGGQFLSGYLKSLVYYPTSVSADSLEALTS